MKKLSQSVLIILLVFISCQPPEEPEFIQEISILDGVINFNGAEYIIGPEKSNFDIKLKRNLILNPYNLFITIQVDGNNITAPTLFYYSDFDRKINPGDTYRLPVTTKLEGDFEYIAGQTGGRIFFENSGRYGMELGSQLQITIAEEGETIIDNTTQFLHLKGDFVVVDEIDFTEKKIGDFDIKIYGNYIIDLELF